jgi:hypothetical protein
MTDYDLEEKYDWERGVKWIWSRPITPRKIAAQSLHVLWWIAPRIIAGRCAGGMKKLYMKETGNWWL